MDAERFDGLTKTLEEFTTRRQALKAVGAGGVAAALGAIGLDAEAKKKKGKGKKKNRCKKPYIGCSTDNQCCDNQCCTFYFDDFTDHFCLSPSSDACCPPEIGGSCAPTHPNCCTEFEGGGWCIADKPVCCPFFLGGAYCCGEGQSCGDGLGCCDAPNSEFCLANSVQDEDYCCDEDSFCCEEDPSGCCEFPERAGAAERRGPHRVAFIPADRSTHRTAEGQRIRH